MNYAGLFAKVRPGAIFIGEITSGFDCNRTSSGSVCRPNHHHFALDAGAEFYPSRRSIIRLDAGDTVIRMGAHRVPIVINTDPVSGAPAQVVVVTAPSETTHNFQGSIGFAYRF